MDEVSRSRQETATAVIETLKSELGAVAVLTKEAIGERYRSDRSYSGTGVPVAVLRPASTAEVSVALRLCHRYGQTVVPQGGMTGLAGGANASPTDIVISLERLRGIEEIDTAAATVTVRAGTPLQEVQEAAEAAGFLLGIDLGARGTCQVGGVLSTNAGGNRVIRYGMARDNVLGLEAVLADGTVISALNKMMKNNTGYDVKQLFIGAEGTLGIITRAVLKLHPKPDDRSTALCAVEDYGRVVTLLRNAQRELGGVSAFEAMWHSYFGPSAMAEGLRFFDRDYPFTVIIEHWGSGSRKSAEQFQTFLADQLETQIIADAVIAQSEREARSFWVVREGLSITPGPGLGDFIGFDISLEIGKIGDFAEACSRALSECWPGCHASFYGHVGDANVHILVAVAYRPGEDVHSVERLVYDQVALFRGSISAEHGIGVLKRPYLGCSRSPAELELMRRLKAALDPKGILNPGKVI